MFDRYEREWVIGTWTIDAKDGFSSFQKKNFIGIDIYDKGQQPQDRIYRLRPTIAHPDWRTCGPLKIVNFGKTRDLDLKFPTELGTYSLPQRGKAIVTQIKRNMCEYISGQAVVNSHLVNLNIAVLRLEQTNHAIGIITVTESHRGRDISPRQAGWGHGDPH